MYKAAVLGDYDSIYGFAAIGLDTFPVTDPEEAKVTLKKIADGSHAVIYITEALASQLAEDLEPYRSRLLPSIILIPGVSGNTGAGIAQVKQSVEKAVGSDIIFNNEK